MVRSESPGRTEPPEQPVSLAGEEHPGLRQLQQEIRDQRERWVPPGQRVNQEDWETPGLPGQPGPPDLRVARGKVLPGILEPEVYRAVRESEGLLE